MGSKPQISLPTMREIEADSEIIAGDGRSRAEHAAHPSAILQSDNQNSDLTLTGVAGRPSSLLPSPDFRLLFESAPGLYLVLTPDFRIVAVSDTYLRATKTNREGILGRGIFDVFPDNPDDPTATGVNNLSASLERVVRHRVSDAMAVQKYDIRRPESEGGGFEERYWSPVNSPVIGADNHLAYIIHRVDDVTEFVRLKQRGIEQEQLAQKLLSRSEQMEAEIFMRAQEIHQVNRQLRETNEDLHVQVAERQRAEELLRKAHKKLENRYHANSADLALANERMLQLAAIVESSEDAIISRSLDGVITSWNGGAERLFGYLAGEMIGKTDSALVPPERSNELLSIMAKVRTGEPSSSFETVRVRKDGKHIHVSVSISPIRDREGRIVGVSAISRDISERKLLEQQLRQFQKMEAVGKLAGGIAHDFNNLLTVISGYSAMLLADARTDNDAKELLREIYEAGERAASLTLQLLAFSRKQVLAPKVLDLNTIVRDAERMLKRLIGEDISLTTVPDPELAWVKVDPGQIEQVIMNLVVNARDALPQGGKVTIETANVDLDGNYAQTRPGVKTGHYVMLAVSDNGCGMDEQTKARIFEPFFTTKELGKGTGLGLATVYGVVKQSSGYIDVYSEVDFGTTFKIYLPKVEEQIQSGKLMHALKPTPHGKETILLVEDEGAVRALSRNALQRFGYNVLEASNGREAVRICDQHEGAIHLLVTDVVMPEMGGRQVAERLVALRPSLKVMYVSGYTEDAVVRHGVLEAETAFLRKPFTPSVLACKVREVLDKQ
jgi:PAS domain S-box-containing protein